ncbi:N-acetyl-gamma-glutamyl-phosphate reductase [Candidatus Sumerlaeota bacterium]|nr:N-acetyl-gamma-glutamyl-phosphate reductase [Candidatus Sumerlaeota bacterium]
MSQKLLVSIVGASGYAGGELLRILMFHPHVELKQASSESHPGRPIHSVHANLRGLLPMKYCLYDELEDCDLLFVAVPHHVSMKLMPALRKKVPRIIDLSADFRFRDPKMYQEWYGVPHEAPEMLNEFVYGIVEVARDKIVGAKLVAGAGCNATATILGIYPLVKAGVRIRHVLADIKAGSSEGGKKPSEASHHPERAGCVRSFMPVGHRHTAEVLQVMGSSDPNLVEMAVTAIDMVRGILATIHVTTEDKLTEKDLWRLFREAYKNEPFVRIVKDKSGIFRYPEPKLLAGSNYCDVGFEVDERTGRVVILSAIDNLVKGASGNCVQAMNVMCGFPETTALEFPGLHPV